MQGKTKYKININKKLAYSLLFVCLAYIVFLTIHMFWDMSGNTQRALNQGIEPGSQELEKYIAVASRTWIIQYVSSTIFVLIFGAWTIFSIQKIKIGKIFIFLWIVVWFGFAIAPPLMLKRISGFDIVTIILFLAILCCMFLLFKKIEAFKVSTKYQKMKSRNYDF